MELVNKSGMTDEAFKKAYEKIKDAEEVHLKGISALGSLEGVTAPAMLITLEAQDGKLFNFFMPPELLAKLGKAHMEARAEIEFRQQGKGSRI